jgi:KUP system potassium uptake protein
MQSQSSGQQSLKIMILGAIGVVYGDIGTSPLYALKECFHPSHGVPMTHDNVYGLLSLVFWSLTLVVCVKYLGFILRADNRGEGGTMALVALLVPKVKRIEGRLSSYAFVYLGLFGAALLYGDGIITPSISVLSAVEGLEVATPAFRPVVVPITVVILLGLFAAQAHGTAKLGSIFGPATAIWFFTLIGTGLPWILKHPEVLESVSPLYAYRFFAEHGLIAYLVLSSVVLCITGAEALYSDMGHFGRKPIRIGWFILVFPALLINYFGQGALILEVGEPALANPFYSLAGGNNLLLYPMVGIATIATVIAAQAMISAAFSLTQQGVQLGFIPRITIQHTSYHSEGQIYVPRINQLLAVGCIALVVVFQESSNLAAAYGIAVTGTMVATTLLFFAVSQLVWKWPKWASYSFLVVFMIIDMAFFTSNFMKLAQGGWVPIVVALGVYVVMTTWKRGRQILSTANVQHAIPLDQFFEKISHHKMPTRVEGTAVFLTLNQDIAPPILLHHLRHNHVLHDRVILLTILTTHQPEVELLERIRITDLPHGFVKVVARHGFMQSPDMSEILIHCLNSGLQLDPNKLSFYLGRETLLPTGQSRMAQLRKRLFILLSRNARPATDYFRIPPDQVIEIGTQVQL